jgi:hypothetical protein
MTLGRIGVPPHIAERIVNQLSAQTEVERIDDPIEAADAESEVARPKTNERFDGTLFARVDNKERDSIIPVMQRFDLMSLPAIAIKDEKRRLPDGRIIRRRKGEALHPDRESLATLAEIKRNQGSRVFQAQYQQAPIPGRRQSLSAGLDALLRSATGAPAC